jgi:hypothetical protein
MGPPPGSTDWGSSPGAAPVEVPVHIAGISAQGLPLAQRGGIRVDVAGLLLARSDFPLTTTSIVAEIPITSRLMLDARLPLGAFALGNAMVGMHYVGRASEKFWVTGGGAFGFPMVHNAGLSMMAAARALWDPQEFFFKAVPFVARFGLEGHASIVEVRGQLDAGFGIPIERGEGAHVVIQHALEIQLGHEIGGGVRYQGVAFATRSNPTRESDRFQAALEPFFALRRELVSLRLGLLMPLDGELGPPFKSGWGFRGSVGMNLD